VAQAQTNLPTVVVTGEGQQQQVTQQPQGPAQQVPAEETDSEKVVGGTDRSAETEGADSYATKTTTVGTKGPASLREIPQTVNVITRQQLDDQNLTSVERALDWDPGVTVATGNLYDASLYARGHEIFTFAIDGMTRPLQSIYGTTPDLSFFDRVEVLSGPGTLFNGTGEPGATLNLARKRAGKNIEAGASVIGGQWDYLREEIDLNAPLTSTGSVRARVVAYNHDEGSFVDVTKQEKHGVYGTIEFDVTDNTTLSFGALGEWGDVVGFPGLPTFADGTLLNVSRSTFIGAPWNSSERHSTEQFAELDHIFSNDAKFHAAARWNSRSTDILQTYAFSSVNQATGNFTQGAFGRNYSEDGLGLDTYYTTPFQLFGRENQFTFGADHRSSSQYFEQQLATNIGTNNIYNLSTNWPVPMFTFAGVGPGFNVNRESEFEESGVYGQFKLKPMERVTILTGGRFTDYQNKVRDAVRRTESEVNEDDFTGYAGVTVDVTRNASLYGSYSEIFQPQSEADAGGNPIGARSGFQYEFGIKKELFNGNVNFQAAWFNLEDENRAVAVGNFFAATGEVRTRGVDIRIAGNPIPELKLTGGYVYADTKALTADAEFGEVQPDHSASLFAKYTFLDGALQGWGVGAGVRGVSDFYAIHGTTRISADSYVVADAQLSYDINEHVQAKVDVTNMFDELYYQRVNEVGRGNFYGEPRRVMFRLTAKR